MDSQGVGGQNLGSSLRQLEAALSLTCQQPGDEHPASPHVSQGCSGSHCQKLKDTKRVHRFCTSLRSLTRAVCCVYPSSSQPYEALPAVLRHACCSRHACTSMNPPDKSQFSPFSALTSPLRCPDGAEPNPTSRTPSPPYPRSAVRSPGPPISEGCRAGGSPWGRAAVGASPRWAAGAAL